MKFEEEEERRTSCRESRKDFEVERTSWAGVGGGANLSNL